MTTQALYSNNMGAISNWDNSIIVLEYSNGKCFES